MENEAFDNILTRRSVRVFAADAVSREDLTKVLRAGMAAPSAVNVQPWAFVVVTNRDTLDKLCTGLPYAKMLAQATAAIVVCGVPEKDQRYSRDYWVMDCCAATENILLAVHALGLGAVWTAVYPEQDRVDITRAILNIPKNIIPLNVIPIGIPKNKGHVTDKFKQENIHWQTW
ncbi:MAG: nitroreductase family protein [Nitrospirae bacterium]|nr:nitroreductase family protein [Nitrospirota bacterium]